MGHLICYSTTSCRGQVGCMSAAKELLLKPGPVGWELTGGLRGSWPL